MNRFSQVHIDLEEFPAYRNERWWTGDEDLDWIAYDDFNNNGLQDSDEPLKDDVGRDGLGPEHENYTGLMKVKGMGFLLKESQILESSTCWKQKTWDNIIRCKNRPFYESYKI